MDKKQTWFVQAEMPQDAEGMELCLPTMESWGACHSLIHSPSGDIDNIDSCWVGFFINKDVAEKIKTMLDNE